jgi:hypothetical protein
MQHNCVVEVKAPRFLNLLDKWGLYSQSLLSPKKFFLLPIMQQGSAAFGLALNTLKREVSKLPLKPEPRSAMVPKMCFADPTGYATSSQEIRGYISVMANIRSTYFLIKGIMSC